MKAHSECTVPTHYVQSLRYPGSYGRTKKNGECQSKTDSSDQFPARHLRPVALHGILILN